MNDTPLTGMNTMRTCCVHSRFRFSGEPVWNNLNDYGLRIGSHNPIIINEPISCCLQNGIAAVTCRSCECL